MEWIMGAAAVYAIIALFSMLADSKRRNRAEKQALIDWKAGHDGTSRGSNGNRRGGAAREDHSVSGMQGAQDIR